MAKKKAMIVTGSSGLVGSAFIEHYLDGNPGGLVYGIDNDSRKSFFGEAGSTQRTTDHLQHRFPRTFRPIWSDIRDRTEVERIFASVDVVGVVHAAGQPSHDYATEHPLEDFDVNAMGTITLLDLARRYAPESPFVFLSTNKVYGDAPNDLPYRETGTRFEPVSDRIRENGFSESLSIDARTHSLYGCSKTSADLYVQEFGRYFGLPTVVFRPGCISGASHRGVEKHGFLSHLVRSLASPEHFFRVIGFGGKQVRDTIDASDLAEAIGMIFEFPNRIEPGRSVFNIGGGPNRSVSVREAITIAHDLIVDLTGDGFAPSIDSGTTRIGDHQWWISDFRRFAGVFPEWSGPTKSVEHQIREIALGVLAPGN